ncbi:hypothetical protein EV126DRAFT_331073 [Verticillium dahliae]|nr:hypothetical protein EV126DRAFT_331073 [Verticillium dahliae]
MDCPTASSLCTICLLHHSDAVEMTRTNGKSSLPLAFAGLSPTLPITAALLVPIVPQRAGDTRVLHPVASYTQDSNGRKNHQQSLVFPNSRQLLRSQHRKNNQNHYQ